MPKAGFLWRLINWQTPSSSDKKLKWENTLWVLVPIYIKNEIHFEQLYTNIFENLSKIGKFLEKITNKNWQRKQKKLFYTD